MMNASVKRAVMASLDRMRAEKQLEAADENYHTSIHLEKLARAALNGDEDYSYGVALTNALNTEQEAGRL